jgi:hypothetical protein
MPKDRGRGSRDVPAVGMCLPCRRCRGTVTFVFVTPGVAEVLEERSPLRVAEIHSRSGMSGPSSALRRLALVAAPFVAAMAVFGCRRSPPPRAHEAPDRPVSRHDASAVDPLEAADRTARGARRSAARQAAVRVATRLLELRDANQDGGGGGCQRFESVGPQATGAARVKRGCSPAASVQCLEADSGFYVPVGEQDDVNCLWDLWYVPKRGAMSGPREPRAFVGFLELKESFTTRMFLDDLNADGLQEAVLVRAGGLGTVDVVLPTGRRETLPFYDLRDADGDGLLDGILEFRNEDAGRVHRGPTFVARRTPAGRFSLNDAWSIAQRRSACRPPLAPVLARGRPGRVDEQETLRRSLCSVVGGADAEGVRREVDAACVPPACHGLSYSLDRDRSSASFTSRSTSV